jgi:hypothetical protein
MDPSVVGVIIGVSILVSCGGVRLLADYLNRRRIQNENLPLCRNPILLKQHRKVKSSFVQNG